MILKTNSTFGNFAIEAEAEVSDEQRDALATLGLLQLLQRSPASAAEKAMAKYDKRPAGFKRDSIPFNAENQATLEAELQKAIAFPKGEDEKPMADPVTCTVAVSEYVPTAADVKMVDERAAYARHAKDLPEFAEKIGYKGELGDGTKENAPVEYLRSIRAYVNALRAAL